MEPAQRAFEAYGEAVGWKNFTGNPMPKWDKLPETIRGAWRAAVEAVGVPPIQGERAK